MRKYKSVDFQFDPEIERTARRLRREHRELQAAVAMNDLQSGNNNIIHMANDRDRVIRDYAVLTPQAIHLGIVRPDVQADNFELKPVMFQMLQTVGQFNGLPSEDPHLHLKLFLELETFYNGLNQSTRLMVDASANGALLSKSYNEAYEILEIITNNNYQWPSTRQAAARGTAGVHNVDALTTLSAQVTLLTKMVKAMTTAPATVNQISDMSHVYCGEGHLFDNCPGNPASVNYMGSFNRQNQDNPYSNTHNPGWRQHPNFSWSYHNQTAAVPSGQNRPAQPPGFYQQNQEQISINNDQLSSLEGLIKDYIVKNEAVVQNHTVSLRNLENQIGQLAAALSNIPQGSLPSNTEDPRREGKEHCKVINLRSGKDVHSPVGHTGESSQAAAFAKNDDPTPVDNKAVAPTQNMTKEKQSAQPAAAQQFRHPPPFPQRFQKQQQDKQFSKILGVIKQLHINIPFVEALQQMPNYAKFLKDILTKKIRLGEFETVALTQECSRMLQSKIPQKMKDPRSFTIPYSIGTKYSGKALCDLGASINLMPLSVFKQLGVGECRPTTVTLQLADRSHAYPEGNIEDVLVKTLIDVKKGELTMRMNDQQVTFNVLDAMKSPDEIEDCNFISVVDFVVAERLHSCCSKEEINAVTFEELDDKDRGAANITWLGRSNPLKLTSKSSKGNSLQTNKNSKLTGRE
ncbi:hypothetical protein KPL71_008099 [Citrus sinensis]|uniref:Uncharacterized protein n=1 Tax=Citrus sinensis TaxID=2711 RepID=A0ACB8M490_CITSI|nr:hypothetical protein KPL71_008099 [Citrus sinensis]